MEILEFHKPILRRANIAAYSNTLICPTAVADGGICGANKWRFVEQISPFRVRYRCRVCGRTVKYDFSNNPNAAKEVYGKNTDKIIQNTLSKFKNLFKRQSV